MPCHSKGNLEYLLDKYGDICTDELTQPNYMFKPNEQPRFFKPWAVPYALKDKVEDELYCLECESIGEKVTHSDWA